jgi:hypothetical protein
MSKEKKNSEQTATGNDTLGVVSMSYGFQIGDHIFEIEADSEQKAMMTLVKEHWGWIDKLEKVELLGGCEK